MSRRRRTEKRKIVPDARYNSEVVAKFINGIMYEGKKDKAEVIVYGALDFLADKYKIDPFETFMGAVNNVKPSLELSSVRVGGSNYQVPKPVSPARAAVLAKRWIINASRKRSEKTMLYKLAEEIYDAFNERGSAVKAKVDMHKMASANKAFSHLASRNAPDSN